jgi:hypothetical protein
MAYLDFEILNKKITIITSLIFLTGLIAVFFLPCSVSAADPPTAILQNEDIIVVYEPPLKNAAGEILQVFPVLKQELEEIFAWHLDIKPQVVLINSNQTFKKLAGNALIVAFAVPARNLIVIDYSKMKTRPFNLHTTFKHELCHLLLHRHVSGSNLARWLDEGVCQLVSDGIGEILIDKSWSGLDAAVMAGRTLRLSRLTERFPRDKASLMLAYEQSKSVVTYIDRQYGSNAVLNILEDLKNGEALETAISQRLSLSIAELESQWHSHLESPPRWLFFLASHIYAIIFFLAAVLTVVGYIRHMRRKKAIYEKWEEEDE